MFCGSGGIVVAVVVDVDLWVKSMQVLALALSTNPHPLTYLHFNGDLERGAFSLFRVVEAWAKRYFSVLVLRWEDSGALEVELLCTEAKESILHNLKL